MEVDNFAIHKLNDLKVRVLTGEVTDFPGDPYRHIANMTCCPSMLHKLLPLCERRWQWQLEQLLHRFRIVLE